jgi:nitrate reductase delta subunit
MITGEARTPATAPAQWDLGAIYRLSGELLLNPEIRDQERIEALRGALPAGGVRDHIEAFLAARAAHDVDEYTQTLELTPPCPLYIGTYLYDEPNSCRGAGACGRNGYMIELGALYEHYGLQLGSGELPDFLPVMLEFLALSLERTERDGVGLRRRFVDKQVRPGLPPLRAALQKYESVYDQVIAALELALEEDLERMAGDPIWMPPEVAATVPPPSPRAAGSAINLTNG